MRSTSDSRTVVLRTISTKGNKNQWLNGQVVAVVRTVGSLNNGAPTESKTQVEFGDSQTRRVGKLQY